MRRRLSAGARALLTCLAATACKTEIQQPVAVSTAFSAADSLRIEGRSAAAGARYRVLRDSFAAVHDTASLWRAQLWFADALLKQGKRDSADDQMNLAIALAGNDPDRMGWTRYEHSIFLDRVGKLDSAFTEATAARQLAVKTHDQPLEASTFHALGRINSLSGRYREALASNEQAMAIEREYRAAPRLISNEMNELGIDYKHLGRFNDAVAIYDSALLVARRSGNPESIARLEFNLGEIKRTTGDVDDALALFTDALTRSEQIGEVRGMAFVHGGLAEIYLGAGAYDRARDHLDKALAINRAAKLPYGEVQNLEELGRIDIEQGHAAGADSLLRAALSIADGGHYGKERSTVRAALARAAALRKDKTGARRWADAAVGIADSLGDPEPQAEARSARGVALEISNGAAATAAYVDAIDLLESWRGRLALGDLRMGVAEPHLEAYEGAIRTLVSAGKFDDALGIAERARARLLLELMAERDLHAGHLSHEDDVRQRLRERFVARSDASDANAHTIDVQIVALTRELDSIQSAARAADVRAGIRYPNPSSVRDLRTGLLGQNRALIVFFWGERDVYGWWTTIDGTHAARLGTVDSVAATIDFLRGALAHTGSSPDWRPASIHAYKQLIAPLSPSSAAEVFVIADGPIATIPVEMLMPSIGSDPLGASTRVIYGPSASVLLALSKSKAQARWDREVLAVGNPSGRSSGANSIRSGSDTGVDELPPLPRAEAEARAVASALGGDALVGTDATLARWLTLDPSRYRYLHFATHALFNDKQPDRTALLLADSRLDLPGIRRLRLSSELVTLSACETGLGQRFRGEGTIGLPHAFLSAGARSVLVSLWKVEDDATAEYMADFYGKLKQGQSPEEAMLAIRRSRIREKGPRSRPSAWAPFVLVGVSGSGTAITGH